MSLTLLATGEGGADLVGLANGGLFIFIERFWFLQNIIKKYTWLEQRQTLE